MNFFKAIRYALESANAPQSLLDRVEHELAQSIYSKLAEELFVSIVTDPTGDRRVKVAAAHSLFKIWEDRLSSEIDDFAPVLDSGSCRITRFVRSAHCAQTGSGKSDHEARCARRPRISASRRPTKSPSRVTPPAGRRFFFT